MTSATLRNSKNKSSTLVTSLISLYPLVLPNAFLCVLPLPWLTLPAILNAEHGGLPSSISSSPTCNPVISKNSWPDNFLISSGMIGVSG